MKSELYFRFGEVEGFTSIKLANKQQGWATPIRELLQNSLDASREAGQGKCEVKIYIERISTNDIPHINEYKEALYKAEHTHKQQSSLNANANRVVTFIKDELDKPELTILMFSDNGTGLNQEKMDALLSGASMHQTEESGGSYGVGNLSSYSLSSLRYVLYATKYEDKNGKIKTLFTGSPILAGHKDGDAQRGNRGRIVAEIPRKEKNPEFIYPCEFPDFIEPKMDEVDRGTIVAVLGLSETWSEGAEYAIVSNFFHAISHGALSIEVYVTDNKTMSIDTKKVESLIFAKKDGKRATGEDILSGQAIHQVWNAINGNNNQEQINLSNGDNVYVHIKNDPDAIPTIVLIRNGMLIARHDSMLSGDINGLRNLPDLVPFTAVIDVDQEHSPKFFKLVKGAEGPYHNKLEKNRLTLKEEKELKKLFKELSNNIKKHLQEIKRDSFELPLFSIPNESAIKGGGKSGGQRLKAEKVNVKIKPVPGPRPEPNLDPNPPGPAPVISSRPLKSTVAVRYTDEGNEWRVQLQIVPKVQNDKDEVYLSIYVGSDNDNWGTAGRLEFETVEMNGEPITITEVKKQVKLGQLQQGAKYNIVAKCKKTTDAKKMKIALRPDLGLSRVKEK